MILVYPMLKSKNVSSLILPGLCKALERLVLIYDMDYVAQRTGLGKFVGFGLKMAEKKVFEGEKFLYYEDQISPGNKSQKAPEQDPKSLAKEIGKEIAGYLSNSKKGEKDLKFAMSSEKMLSVEPTWVSVEGSLGSRIIGIKIIPVDVNSSVDIGALMMSDVLLKKFDLFFAGMQRKYTRILWSFLRGVMKLIPGYSDQTLTGNPTEDIIYASSKYKHNIFCLMSMADLKDDTFFNKAGGIDKLFYLGWSSILIADDVNKVVTCCMKQFGGLCSKMTYGQLYANFGKEHFKVYSDASDVKKSTSPFFSSRVNSSKIFGESMANDKASVYTECSMCNNKE